MDHRCNIYLLYMANRRWIVEPSIRHSFAFGAPFYLFSTECNVWQMTTSCFDSILNALHAAGDYAEFCVWRYFQMTNDPLDTHRPRQLELCPQLWPATSIGLARKLWRHRCCCRCCDVGQLWPFRHGRHRVWSHFGSSRRRGRQHPFLRGKSTWRRHEAPILGHSCSAPWDTILRQRCNWISPTVEGRVRDERVAVRSADPLLSPNCSMRHNCMSCWRHRLSPDRSLEYSRMTSNRRCSAALLA